MQITLFDTNKLREQLLPLTYTRPIADLRVGILTIAEKWGYYADSTEIGYATHAAVQPVCAPPYEEGLWINGAILPDKGLWDAISGLQPGETLAQGDMPIALNKTKAQQGDLGALFGGKAVLYPNRFFTVERPWLLQKWNGPQLFEDYQLLIEGRESQPIEDPFTRVYSPELLFIEEDVEIKAAIIDAESGPVYLGKGARVLEGSVIIGPFAMGEYSQLNPGAKMRGNTTLGPHCKVGGEVSNSVIIGYSNKGHDGFLGNSVLGHWCNLGADTNTSNLKNNYSEVRAFSYAEKNMVDTGEQFCGLIMGDHSKCGINTMFNTGTVVGVGANIYGGGFPPKHIPSFAWGGAAGFETYELNKALDTARSVMQRRELELSAADEALLRQIHEETQYLRDVVK